MNIKETEHANINPARFLSFRRENPLGKTRSEQSVISQSFTHSCTCQTTSSRTAGGREAVSKVKGLTLTDGGQSAQSFEDAEVSNLSYRMACEAGALCPFSTLQAVSSAPLTAGSARPSHSSQTQQPMGGCLSILNPPPSDPITEVTKSKGPGLFVSGND